MKKKGFIYTTNIVKDYKLDTDECKKQEDILTKYCEKEGIEIIGCFRDRDPGNPIVDLNNVAATNYLWTQIYECDYFLMVSVNESNPFNFQQLTFYDLLQRPFPPRIKIDLKGGDEDGLHIIKIPIKQSIPPEIHPNSVDNNEPQSESNQNQKIVKENELKINAVLYNHLDARYQPCNYKEIILASTKLSLLRYCLEYNIRVLNFFEAGRCYEMIDYVNQNSDIVDVILLGTEDSLIHEDNIHEVILDRIDGLNILLCWDSYYLEKSMIPEKLQKQAEYINELKKCYPKGVKFTVTPY